MNVDNLWSDFLSTIKEQISSLAYSTWFENAKIHSVENKTITISTPTHIHKKQLKEKYNVMSVPCIVINDKTTVFGKKNVEELLALLS